METWDRIYRHDQNGVPWTTASGSNTDPLSSHTTVLYRTLILYVNTLLHTCQYCVLEIRCLCLCWTEGKGIIELRLAEMDGNNRSMRDTCATGEQMWKTHQLSKRIKSGVPNLGIKVEWYRAQDWVCTLWLTTMWKSWVKLLELRAECPTLQKLVSPLFLTLWNHYLNFFISQTHRNRLPCLSSGLPPGRERRGR